MPKEQVPHKELSDAEKIDMVFDHFIMEFTKLGRHLNGIVDSLKILQEDFRGLPKFKNK